MSKSELKAAAVVAAAELVTSQSVTAALKRCEPRVAMIRENHATPDGSDIKAMARIFTSRSSVAIIMAAFDWTPAELEKRVFDFRATFAPQRCGNDYMPLKAMVKLEALAIAVLTGNAGAYINSTKYLYSQVTLLEALGISEVSNADVYALYTSNATRINALLDTIDDSDLRATLKNAELYKAESTASTQRVTSAWLFQILDAGENAGNERVIRVDKTSDNYAMIKALVFNS